MSVAVLAAMALHLDAQTTYRRATIDTAGQLRLVTSAGKAIVPPKDSGQVGFESAIVSDDRRSVGWVALYPNCCTSWNTGCPPRVVGGCTPPTAADNQYPVFQMRTIRTATPESD